MERTNSKMSEPSPLGQSEGYGACENEVAHKKRPLREKWKISFYWLLREEIRALIRSPAEWIS